MLKVLFPTLMLAPTVALLPPKKLWPSSLAYSFFIAFSALLYFFYTQETGWVFVGSYTATDPLSTPLLALTCWLLPLMILASQGHTSLEPTSRQRSYLLLLISLQFFLILAFSATELIIFYIMFEATLIPTLIIITRWGNQSQRLNAGIYFLFYTLAGSLPLLVALLLLQGSTGSLSLFVLQFSPQITIASYADKAW